MSAEHSGLYGRLSPPPDRPTLTFSIGTSPALGLGCYGYHLYKMLFCKQRFSTINKQSNAKLSWCVLFYPGGESP